MKHILFLTIVFSILLTSCAVKTRTSKTSDIHGSGVIHKPVLVDLDVKEGKVTGTATAAQWQSLKITKHDAVADALKKANADVLVEPTFATETFLWRTTATVTGFAATYKNFRPIKEEDLKLLQVGVTQKANVYEPNPKEIQKKRRRMFVVGAVGVVTVIQILRGLGDK